MKNPLKISINIPLNLNKSEAVIFLKKTTVLQNQKVTVWCKHHNIGIEWINLENPNRFRVLFNDSTLFTTKGRASLISTTCKNKTVLSIDILPPVHLLLIIILLIYAITRFGVHNYGTSAFLPSIIIPALVFGSVIFVWWLILRKRARRIQKEFIHVIQKHEMMRKV